MRTTLFLGLAACLAFGTPAGATSRYEFAGTLAENLLSWPAGTSIAFTGLLTDPALLPGGTAASAIEIPDLRVGGVAQTGVQATVLLLSSPANRFELFVRFEGANGPDITVIVDLPPGDESAFPEIDFDLFDPAVSLVVAEMNEDGILPQPIDLTSFTGVVLPEPGAVASTAAVATLLALARRRG